MTDVTAMMVMRMMLMIKIQEPLMMQMEEIEAPGRHVFQRGFHKHVSGNCEEKGHALTLAFTGIFGLFSVLKHTEALFSLFPSQPSHELPYSE